MPNRELILILISHLLFQPLRGKSLAVIFGFRKCIRLTAVLRGRFETHTSQPDPHRGKIDIM